MNRGELERQIAKQTDLPLWVVNAVITGFLEVTLATVKRGEQVMVRGFGAFVPRIKSAAKKKNPRSGEPMRIPKRKTMVFLPSAQAKEKLNGRRRSTH